MGYVLLFGVFFVYVVFWAAKKLSRPAGLQAGGAVLASPRLPRGRVHARGLVLSASQQSTGATQGGRRFESRRMTLDVEIPGEAPYVTQGTFLVPRGLEAIPGSTLELSVSRSDQTSVTVLGPGGFTGPWLNNGPPNAY
ncbi:MAG: hypothetical protein ACRELB_12320 [Polyangiaceae bacterium]